MPNSSNALSAAQIESFVADGFVRIDHAFPTEIADQCRALLWQATGCDPDNPATWTKPVIRIDYRDDAPFRGSVNTPILHTAFDQLVGKGRWAPRGNMGTFPIRFPSPDDPGDAGWHIDASYGWNERPNDFMSWQANIFSRDRALLMLFLYSDVGEDDAPTRIRAGSHLQIARRTRTRRRGRPVAARPERDRLLLNRTSAGSTRHWSGRYGLSVPSVRGACGPTASRHAAEVHGPATAPAAGTTGA